MFNNDVTYNEKWNTKENHNALTELKEKYFSRSECMADCPPAWAPEVLELFNKLDKELGIKYNESTLNGFVIRKNWVSWFVTGPWLDMIPVIKSTFNPPKYGTPKPLLFRIFKLPSRMISAFKASFNFGFRAFRPKYLNRHLNKFFNKRITLGQVKEKYGELRIYSSCEDAFSEYVDQEVRRCEIKLAMKGAYYPLENFYNSSVGYYVGTTHRPDVIKVNKVNEDGTVDISQTVYRKVMKDLGVNLEELSKKAKKEEEC